MALVVMRQLTRDLVSRPSIRFVGLFSRSISILAGELIYQPATREWIMRWPWDPRPPMESADRRQEVLLLISKRLKECEDALRTDPQDVDALFTRGVFLARIGEYWRSLECLNQVTEINAGYPGVWHLKSSLYAQVGDQGAARQCRERAQAE